MSSLLASFTRNFLKANGVSSSQDHSGAAFVRWHLPPGSGFGDERLWWGECRKRPGPHEGMDFHAWETSDGRIIPFTPDTRIPLPENAVLEAECPDFLGRTLIFRRRDPIADAELSGIPCLFLAHLAPVSGLRPGAFVPAGTVIGYPTRPARPIRPAHTVSDNAAPLHLHLSVGHCHPSRVLELRERGWSWKLIADPDIIRLTDPAME